MTYIFTTNQTPTTGSVSIFNLKSLLVSSGWVVKSSGDGTTLFSTTDGISTGGTGAGGLGNTTAWFRIQDPAAARELTFQRVSNDTIWRMKYSTSAKFTGGSQSATQTPTATDEQIWSGGGTDASPSGSTIFASNTSYRQQIAADNTSNYTWYMCCYPIGGGVPTAGLAYDYVDGFATGDNDPIVIYRAIGGAGNVFQVASIGSNTALPNASVGVCQGYLKKGLTGEGWVSLPGMIYSDSSSGLIGGAPANICGTNPHTNKDDVFPVMYARISSITSPTGYKGVSHIFRWMGTNRSTGDTLSINTSMDRIILGSVALPWDGVTIPSL